MKLIRIEAVNLSNSLDDTEDLSTRRGGGLSLLSAIEHISDEFSADLKPISTGASTGLFEVSESSNISTDEIHEKLYQSDIFGHATFVVSEVHNQDFKQAEIGAINANHWQQMQNLTFSTKGLTANTNGVCEFDELRPGRHEKRNPDNSTIWLSDSVKSRRDYGLDAKREFYRTLLDHSRYKDIRFTFDFESLSSKPSSHVSTTTLANKIAVFYVDGNAFGGIPKACQTAEKLNNWDSFVKRKRKALLARLMDHALQNPHWLTKDGSIRLETLLWGGDELMFVVPAWCGLELADLFFQETRGMQYPEDATNATALSHSAGLVLCHHNAPISRITKLAKALAEKAKETSSRTHNALNWIILESFDQTGGDLDEYLEKRFPSGMSWEDLQISAETLSDLKVSFRRLQKTLPRSPIVSIARAMANGSAFNADDSPHPLIARACEQVSEAGGNDFYFLFDQLLPKHGQIAIDLLSPSSFPAWLKLAELWDYAPLAVTQEKN